MTKSCKSQPKILLKSSFSCNNIEEYIITKLTQVICQNDWDSQSGLEHIQLSQHFRVSVKKNEAIKTKCDCSISASGHCWRTASEQYCSAGSSSTGCWPTQSSGFARSSHLKFKPRLCWRWPSRISLAELFPGTLRTLITPAHHQFQDFVGFCFHYQVNSKCSLEN